MAKIGSNRRTQTECKTEAGRMLRELRLKMGLSTYMVAPLANIAPSTWAHTETQGSTKLALKLMKILLEIENKPGEIKRLVREYRENFGKRGSRAKSEKQSYGKRASLDLISDLDKRLTYLETALGVTNDEK